MTWSRDHAFALSLFRVQHSQRFGRLTFGSDPRRSQSTWGFHMTFLLGLSEFRHFQYSTSFKHNMHHFMACRRANTLTYCLKCFADSFEAAGASRLPQGNVIDSVTCCGCVVIHMLDAFMFLKLALSRALKTQDKTWSSVGNGGLPSLYIAESSLP